MQVEFHVGALQGQVALVPSKPIAWLSLTPEQAMVLSEKLYRASVEAKGVIEPLAPASPGEGVVGQGRRG